MANKHEAKLGAKAKDNITGFTGIIVAVTEWLNGCIRVMIQPQEMREGKPIDAHSFDIEQITVLEQTIPEPAKNAGGPKPDPVRQKAPA